jgi:hypothetical protein
MIVDFIKVDYHFFKSNTLKLLKSEDIIPELLPRRGDFIVIDNITYSVEQVTYYPFGDKNGVKGAKVYINIR